MNLPADASLRQRIRELIATRMARGKEVPGDGTAARIPLVQLS